MNLDNLSPQERFIMEWQYGIMGDFEKSLIRTISLAGEVNLLNLSRAFPMEVEGYINFTRIDGWWQNVQRKAGIVNAS
jgi:hypothetical protein